MSTDGHRKENLNMKRNKLTWVGAAAAVVIVVAIGVKLSGGDGGVTSPEKLAVPSGEVGQDVGFAAAEPFSLTEEPPALPSGGESLEAAPDSDGAVSAAGSQGSLLDRKIVQTASLDLTVKEVGPSFEDVSRIATAAGGFVASSTFSRSDDRQIASVTMRVPATQYQEVLRKLRGLAVEVVDESSDASDVTEEYTDLSARLRNLEATEAQYLLLLGEAKEIGDILQVQDRINTTRGEIEQVKGRLNLLDNLTDLATITVTLRPETAPVVTTEPGGPDPAKAAGEAWQASLDVLRGIASGLVTVAVFSWWLVPLLALAAFLVARVLPRAFAPRPIDKGSGAS
jgi:hypothetical protein